MHVITRKPFRDAAVRYPNSRTAIDDCYRILKKGTFKTPDELRQVFPSLDNFKYLDRWWVINISGNHLRLLAFIDFKQNRFYVRHIVTQVEYDKLTDKYKKEGKKK